MPHQATNAHAAVGCRSERGPTVDAIRELFGDAFLLIRFAQLRVEEFDDGPRHSGFLTPEVTSWHKTA